MPIVVILVVEVVALALQLLLRLLPVKQVARVWNPI
jgi:hypothetical protein